MPNNSSGSPEQPFEFDDDDQALMESPDMQQSNHSRMRRSDLDSHNNGQDEEEEYGRDADQEDLYDYFIPVAAGSAQTQSLLSAQQDGLASEENMEGRVDYHVMDDGGVQDEDEEEMLDEDELRARNANIL